MVKLDVIYAHMRNYYHTDAVVGGTTKEIVLFCRSLANLYQVTFPPFFWIGDREHLAEKLLYRTLDP
jgi:hypothetical protein